MTTIGAAAVLVIATIATGIDRRTVPPEDVLAEQSVRLPTSLVAAVQGADGALSSTDCPEASAALSSGDSERLGELIDECLTVAGSGPADGSTPLLLLSVNWGDVPSKADPDALASQYLATSAALQESHPEALVVTTTVPDSGRRATETASPSSGGALSASREPKASTGSGTTASAGPDTLPARRAFNRAVRLGGEGSPELLDLAAIEHTARTASDGKAVRESMVHERLRELLTAADSETR